MMTSLIRKSIIFVCFILISLVFINISYAKIDPKTIAGLWLMNEGKGDTVEDISGNKNHGTIMGKAKWSKGKFGGRIKSKNFLSRIMVWKLLIM